MSCVMTRRELDHRRGDDDGKKGTGVERRRLALMVAAGDKGTRSHKACYDSNYICSNDSPE